MERIWREIASKVVGDPEFFAVAASEKRCNERRQGSLEEMISAIPPEKMAGRVIKILHFLLEHRQPEITYQDENLRISRAREHVEKLKLQVKNLMFTLPREESALTQSTKVPKEGYLKEFHGRVIAAPPVHCTSSIELTSNSLKFIDEQRYRSDIGEDRAGKKDSCLASISIVHARLEKLIELHKKLAGNLQELRRDTEERYSTCLCRYDHHVGKQETIRRELRASRDFIKTEYAITERQLLLQRVSYQAARAEWEFLLKEAFDKRVANFRDNRAARIIQRAWRLHRLRLSSKMKKRSKK